MERRTFLKLSTGSLFSIAGGPLFAQAKKDPDYEDYDGNFPTMLQYGTQPSLPEENRVAKELLDAAPRKVPHIDVARYFEQITRLNEQNELYKAAWSTRWNPVIVGFYRSTSLAPKYVYTKGDTIAWCAAFMNWCLEASGMPTTESASSGSFKEYGDEVEGPNKPRGANKPMVGDVVVFKSADPALAAVGRGHVAFYLGEEKDSGGRRRLIVLGGNQKGGKKYSSVNVGNFPEKSGVLELHSIRRPKAA